MKRAAAVLSRGAKSRKDSRAFRGLFLSVGLLVAANCSSRVERHEMQWEYGPATPADPSEVREVILRFSEEPRCWVWFLSRDLGPKLEELGRRDISVEFRIRRSWGRVKGFRVVRIEGIGDWDRPRSGVGSKGAERCPPW